MKNVETIMLSLFSGAYQRTLERKEEFKYRMLSLLLLCFLFLVGCLSGQIHGNYVLYYPLLCLWLIELGSALYTYLTGKRFNEHGLFYPNTKRNVLIECGICILGIAIIYDSSLNDPEVCFFSLPALLVTFLLASANCLADWIYVNRTQPEGNG